MNVLFVTAFSAVGSTAGSPKVVRALMRELRDRGHEVSVLQIYVDYDIFPGIYFTLEQFKGMGLAVTNAFGDGFTFIDDGFRFHLVPGFVASHDLQRLGRAQTTFDRS